MVFDGPSYFPITADTMGYPNATNFYRTVTGTGTAKVTGPMQSEVIPWSSGLRTRPDNDATVYTYGGPWHGDGY
jgi:hypothetical protein